MSLLAHYKLNGNANNSSSNGLHGAPTAVSWVVGKIDLAGSFNGTTSYVDCGSRFAPAGNATFCVWIKPTVLSSAQRFMSQLGSSAGDMLIRLLDATGNIRFIRWTGVDGSIQYWTTVSAGVVVNEWNFVCVTYSSGVVTIQINDATETPSLASVTSAHAEENFKIGGDGDGKYSGLCDDARIYDEVLPDWKIQAIYNHGRGTEACQPWQRLIRPTIQPVIQPLMGAT